MGVADIAVVGGGVAGLVCARELTARGLAVEVLDKGRGPGGRTCSRRHMSEAFDHGAQYFTVRDPRFEAIVDELAKRGAVERWRARFGFARAAKALESESSTSARWVGVPRMSRMATALAEGQTLRRGCRVASIERAGPGWRLYADDGDQLGDYPGVVLAMPAPQARQLLQGTALETQLSGVSMAPCWAAMISFDEEVRLAFDAVRFDDAPVSWFARDSSKPGRSPGHRWVAHAAPSVSRAMLDETPERVLASMLHALHELIGALPSVRTAVAHRWRYARVERPLGAEALYDEPSRIGACGDWCLGARIEQAAVSGLAMADMIAGERLEDRR